MFSVLENNRNYRLSWNINILFTVYNVKRQFRTKQKLNVEMMPLRVVFYMMLVASIVSSMGMSPKNRKCRHDLNKYSEVEQVGPGLNFKFRVASKDSAAEVIYGELNPVFYRTMRILRGTIYSILASHSTQHLLLRFLKVFWLGANEDFQADHHGVFRRRFVERLCFPAFQIHWSNTVSLPRYRRIVNKNTQIFS